MSTREPMGNRPTLEILSWIAGILSFLFAVYLFLKAPSEQITAPQQLMSIRPSFDCLKASKWVEHQICNSHELSVLDLSLANAYRDLQVAATKPGKAAELKISQNNWLNQFRNSCKDKECLIEVYKKRISAFESWRL